MVQIGTQGFAGIWVIPVSLLASHWWFAAPSPTRAGRHIGPRWQSRDRIGWYRNAGHSENDPQTLAECIQSASDNWLNSRVDEVVWRKDGHAQISIGSARTRSAGPGNQIAVIWLFLEACSIHCVCWVIGNVAIEIIIACAKFGWIFGHEPAVESAIRAGAKVV